MIFAFWLHRTVWLDVPYLWVISFRTCDQSFQMTQSVNGWQDLWQDDLNGSFRHRNRLNIAQLPANARHPWSPIETSSLCGSVYVIFIDSVFSYNHQLYGNFLSSPPVYWSVGMNEPCPCLVCGYVLLSSASSSSSPFLACCYSIINSWYNL